MEVILRGGPLDGNFKDVSLDDNFRPYPVMKFPAELPTLSVGVYNSPVDPKMKIDVLVYELQEVWENGRLHHYEYHYNGR